mgnify:CR=1 FL=1
MREPAQFTEEEKSYVAGVEDQLKKLAGKEIKQANLILPNIIEIEFVDGTNILFKPADYVLDFEGKQPGVSAFGYPHTLKLRMIIATQKG